MKANELRIGNLIEQPNGTNEVFDLTNCEGEIGINTFLEHEIKPIPLTEDVLGKLNFIPESGMHCYEYWYPNENALWSIRKEGNGKWQFCIVVEMNHIMKFDPIMTSLHHLQNLYQSLTGEELVINF